MNTALYIVHWLSGLVVLAEALNKLERTDLFDGRNGLWPRVAGLGWLFVPWRWRLARVVMVVKLAAWALLAIGGAGAVATPFMALEKPSLQDLAVIAGFALLIVRSRLKETQ